MKKLFFSGIAFIFFLLSTFDATSAADRRPRLADVEKLDAQVRTLENDVTVLKETATIKLDAQDKRIGDLGIAAAQQANHVALVSNQTAAVGNYIAYTSIAIALFVALASIFAYRGAKQKAVEEARITSEKWFNENAEKLKNEIEALRTKVDAAKAQIDGDVADVAATKQAANTQISAAVASAILATNDKTNIAIADPADVQAVKEVSAALRNKPEAEFSADDHYARGLAEFSKIHYQSALSSFEQAIQQSSGADTPAIKMATFLFAKASALGQLEQPQDEITVYDEIDRRYGRDDTPGMRERVAGALVNKGFTLGKLEQPQEAIAVYDEIDRRYGKDDTPGLREQVASALFNKGITLGQLAKPQEAIAVYDEIDRHYGNDAAPGVRERVAGALNGGSFNRIISAKKNFDDAVQRKKLLAEAIERLERALKICSVDDRAMVMGNLGYALFLDGQEERAKEPTSECLRLGGQKLLGAQRADATQHRVAPADTEYEALLDRCWAKLHPPIDR